MLFKKEEGFNKLSSAALPLPCSHLVIKREKVVKTEPKKAPIYGESSGIFFHATVSCNTHME